MGLKDIVGLLTLHDKDGRVEHQGSNLSYLYASRYRTIYQWNNNYAGTAPVVVALPFKMVYLLSDDDQNIGHDTFIRSTTNYPDSPTGSATPMSTVQYAPFRVTGTVGNVPAASIPRVIAGLGAASGYPGTLGGRFGGGDQLVSQVDVPLDYTQIGIVYFHPAHQQGNTVATTAGLSYVTYTASQFWDFGSTSQHVFSIVRIETGADAGYYFVQNNDFQSNRLWLRNLDGTPFYAQATASNLLMTAAPGRRAWFNEVSIIPLSVGTVDTAGRYNPRNPAAPYYGDKALRESFIMRFVVEKTGSTEAAVGTEQQGSYSMTLRPFTHGYGALGSAIEDDGFILSDHLYGANGSETIPWLSNLSGGCNGLVLDWENQRMWFSGTTISNTSALFHWRYKTSEGIREVANYLGTAPQQMLTPTPVMGAGDIVTSMQIGSNFGSGKNWVYVAMFHASGGNAGIIVIKPDLTTLQYDLGDGVPSSVLAGCVIDKTRARLGTAADASTDGADNVTSASGGFTAADIGRVIKLTGLGADSGTYKISAINSATSVEVQTLVGGAVTFTTQSGGTFEIGDRLYLFFNNNTTGAGKINYMESLAPGTFLTRTVTMTNGANINTRVAGGTGLLYGQPQMCSVDQGTGDVYWLSNDTQQQINKYDVVANTHAFIAISNTSLLSPAGGVVQGGANPATNPGSPTVFSAIHVNSKFDDVWVGSDNGIFQIPRSNFAAAAVKRHYGADNTTYFAGVPLTTGTGNGTTGLSFSTPNMTINATGTPFTAADVGRWIVITGASTAANNGAFPITAFNSSSSVTFTNASGSAQSNYAGTFYVSDKVAPRPDGAYAGSSGNSRFVRAFYEHPDGKTMVYVRNNTNSVGNAGYFSQATQSWAYKGEINPNNSNEPVAFHFDPWGRFFYVHLSAVGSGARYLIAPIEVHYQWDGAKWVPLEHSRESMPLKGNNVPTDGATTSGSATFTGSGFAAADVGKLLRIESGASIGIYRIGVFNSSTSVDLRLLNGKPFSASATAGTLSYAKGGGLFTRPIHSTHQDTMFGVKVRWNRQGGATPPNNEFLGRGGQSRMTATDGSTTSGSSTFGGSSFVSGDVGKLLRIESGADADVYKITAFISAASVTLTRMNGRPFSASATAGTLTYSVWDLGTPGSNAGPENITVMLADGLGKDNTQDLSGATYEMFGFKTRFSENFEDKKFVVENPLAVPGSTETKVYYETYARASPQYDAALSHHRALPGAETTNGRQLCDWIQDKYLNNAGGRADMYSSPSATTDWQGRDANSSVMGASVMVDLGRDTEVGFVQIRFKSNTGSGYSFQGLTATFHGLVANLYSAPNSGGTPVASSVVRTSGTANINASGANVTTLTLSSGDFLGAVTTGPNTNGAITAGGNTLVAAAATFVTGDRGKVLKLTAGAGADNGSYRIIAVSLDGSTVTVRNLDQTAKAWGGSASGITYEVRDGVQDEDMIAIPSLGAPTHRLCVDRLLSATSAQVRTGPNATVTNQNYQAVVPTWSLVKRLSFSTEALPPDVKNNGTFFTLNGRNQYDNNDALMYFDLTDLSVAQRTGRWWKWTGIPRFNGDSGQDAAFWWSSFEFYSPSGAKLASSRYTSTDQAQTNADFYFSWLNRVDFLQAANNAMSGVAGFNGNVDLGGASGDTLTLTTGGNKFLGHQVRVPYTDGTTTSPNALNSASAAWVTADVGRFVRFTSGTYSGNFYRIASRVSATQVTLVTPSGGAPALATDAGPMNFTVHEGINAGGTAPDRFAIRRLGAAGDAVTTVGTNQLNSASAAFTDADLGKVVKVTGATADNGGYIIKTVNSSTQVTVSSQLGAAVSFAGGTGGTLEFDSDLREYTIATINDALTTITISENLQPAVTNRPWEIRRPGYDTTSTTTEGSKSARITRPMSTYPLQSGDICQDSRGHYRFFPEDIGSGYARADGSMAGSNGNFVGSGFCSDDVGRLLYVDSGVNKGIYEISVFTSATAITVKNHYTGAAVSFTADAGPVSYRVFGDRRFRLAKYCTGLRA